MAELLYLCSLIPFYLLGTFPTGYLISRAKGIEIAKEGSGNVGATNVMRVVGKGAGVLTLIGDVLKGFSAVWIASLVNAEPTYAYHAGVAVVAGHCFSIPGKLKGGKGVATALGVLIYLVPTTAVFVLAVFAAVLEMWKIVSLASVSATIAAPVFCMLTGQPDYAIYSLAGMALLITLRHHANLTRIAHGKEPKMDQRRTA
jgi:glycerol-3-phosphate acyltransferase PlsY